MEIGGHKAIHVRLDGAATDQRVAELNAALDRIVPWPELRNAEALRFAIWDGEIAANAKVMGDDWDLAIYLRSLASLSDELGRRTVVRIELEPDGGELVLKSGRFTRHGKAVESFLADMDRPRPLLEDMFDRLQLDLQISADDAARFETALRAELQRFTRYDRIEITARRADGARSWEIPLDGEARTASFLVHTMAQVWLLAQLPVETTGALELRGARTQRWMIEGWMSLVELDLELRVAVGPAHRPVAAAAPRQSHGRAGELELVSELSIEALGRLTSRFELVAADGAVIDGPTFINVSTAILVEKDGAWFTARIDGRAHLVHLQIPSLRTSTLELWKGDLSDEHVVRTPDSRLLIVRASHPDGETARIEIHEVRDRSVRRLGKRVAADLTSVVEVDDRAVWVHCGRWTSPRFPDQHVEELARIEIATGAVEYLTEDVDRPADSQLEHAERAGDGWLVRYSGQDVVRIAGGAAEF